MPAVPPLAALVRSLTPDAATVPDAELLGRYARDRDQAAFELLVWRHGGLVWSACRRLLAPDHHAAEDACQAAFVALAAHAARLRDGRSVAAWLHRVAVRAALDLRAARRRATPIPSDRLDRPGHGPDPARAAGDREARSLLDAGLDRLPDRLRIPFVLCELEGHSDAEAAAVLGCPVGTVGSRLTRARHRLRRWLAARGVAPVVITAVAVPDAVRAAMARAGFLGEAVAPGVRVLADRAVRSSLGATVRAAVLGAVLAAIGVGLGLAASAGPTPADPPTAGTASAGQAVGTSDAPGEPLPAGVVARLGTTRLRPGASVERMAFSPDGTRLASWSPNLYASRMLIVYDTKTGREVRRVGLPHEHLAGELLAWLPDGRGIALVRTRSEEPGPLVWEFTDEKADPPPGKPRAGGPARLPRDQERDLCFDISPDGQTIAVGRTGRQDLPRGVRLCRLQTGVTTDALPVLKVVGTHPGNCGHLCFTPDGTTLVVFGQAKYLGDAKKWEATQLVTVWDVAGGKEKARFAAPRPASTGLRLGIAVSDTVLAIGLENGDTSLWDLATGKERTLATGHARPKRPAGTTAVAFTPDGKNLVTSGWDCVVKMWDVASGKPVRAMERHFWSVQALAVSPGGRLIASAGGDGVIRLWDAATGADACPLPGHASRVTAVAFAPDGRTAVTVGDDETLRWWDAATGAERRVVATPHWVRGLAVSPDGQTILVGSDGGGLWTWDTATGRETTPAHLPRDGRVGRLSFTPDGRHVVAASGPQVLVWEWPGLKPVHTIELPKPAKGPSENSCQTASVSPDGKWLVTVATGLWRSKGGVSGISDGVVDVWDLATGERVRRVAESQYVFEGGTFTPSGPFVLLGARGTVPAIGDRPAEMFEGEIHLLDPIAGRRVRGFAALPGPRRTGRHAAAATPSPDGHTLWVSYSTSEIVGFEVATGKPRLTLVGHRGHVGGLALSADGRRMLSAGHDSTALVWDVSLTGAAPPRREPLTEAGSEKLWETAASGEPPAAFVAMAELATAPDRAIAVLRRQVRPAPAGPTAADVDRIFAALDSSNFATREAALKDLRGFGESAVPAVRNELEKRPPLEVRLRAEAFLRQFDPAVPSPARVRQARAVELLEGVGTPAARALLAELAAGGASAPLTRDASAALHRLGGG